MSNRQIPERRSAHVGLRIARLLLACVATLTFAATVSADKASDLERLTVVPERVVLHHARSRRQLLVTGHASGYEYDRNRDATFHSEDETVATVDTSGVVHPVRKGTTKIHVVVGDKRAEVVVSVGDVDAPRPVSFTNDVMAVVGKAGCNAGTCHGHSSGKGDFKLSFRGYDLSVDHTALSDSDSGRVDLDVNDDSLILQMPTAQLDHGGGKRFEIESEPYEILRQWIAEGATSDAGTATVLERIEVLPAERTLSRPGLQQQLAVLAHFADDEVRDVTHQASFELSNEGIIQVDSNGLVTSLVEGEAAVFVRFLGKMGLSRFLTIQHKPEFVWMPQPERNFIDPLIHAKLRQIQVAPSELSTDVEFLRRVSLKTVGVPPHPDEVRAFEANDDSSKRLRKIDELIDRNEFGQQWAMYWLELSGSTESGDSARFKGMWMMKFWLEDVINRNLPYDEFVRQVVAGRGSSIRNPGMTFSTNQLARQETVPQLFLGVRLRCAECHDHPFDIWKQADYQALGKFFEGLGYKESALDPYGRDIQRFVPPENSLPWKKGSMVSLRLLDGSTVEAPVTVDRRDVLVDWMFGPARQMTAHAIVNRVWGRLFGRGIVDPVDDMRFSNPSVNEPLLDALAENFIAHDYNFKHLVRTILISRTWQRSSRTNETNAGDQMNFSHFVPHTMPAETLLDSICVVTGSPEQFRIGPPGMRAVNLPYVNIRSRFLKTFGRPDKRMSACECDRTNESTLPQALHLFVGDTLADKIRSEDGRLAHLLAADLTNRQLVEELYLAVLSRFPTSAELDFGSEYLSMTENRQYAAEDVMWALLSSREFILHH